MAISCADCGRSLDDVLVQSPADRPPCPDCGCTRRAFTLVAEPGKFVLTGHAAGFETMGGTLLTQALITPAAKTQEGVLLQSVTTFWSDLVRLFEREPQLMFQIDPIKLEELVAGLYAKHGFEVTLTPRSGDHGRDVIAVKPGFGTVRLIESVKRYGPNHLVPADDVRALMGVLANDQRASKGIVTTTSDFAPRIGADPFIKPLIPFRLELVNGTELLKRLSEAEKR